MSELKLGKLPAKPRPKDIQFSEIVPRRASLIPAPVGFGHYDLFPEKGWGMLGNDNAGDCVWAGAAHETMLVNETHGVTVGFDDAVVLGDYSAVTGYDPVTGANDNGTDMHVANDYRRATGILDAAAPGVRHKIGAYVALEPGNWGQMLEALRAFDFVGIGFEFPGYAMDEFNAGKPWAYQAGGTIEGGHYTPVVGRPHAWTIDVVTWGQIQPMGRKFFETYCDEAYGVLTLESLNASGVTPEGLNLDALNAALAAL